MKKLTVKKVPGSALKKTTKLSKSSSNHGPYYCDVLNIIGCFTSLAPGEAADKMVEETKMTIFEKHLLYGDYSKLIAFLEAIYEEEVRLEFCYFEELTDIYFGLPKSDKFIRFKLNNETLESSFEIKSTYTEHLIDMGRLKIA
jgi:hypothetical protein